MLFTSPRSPRCPCFPDLLLVQPGFLAHQMTARHKTKSKGAREHHHHTTALLLLSHSVSYSCSFTMTDNQSQPGRCIYSKQYGAKCATWLKCPPNPRQPVMHPTRNGRPYVKPQVKAQAACCTTRDIPPCTANRRSQC